MSKNKNPNSNNNNPNSNNNNFKILQGDALLQLQFVRTESIDCVFTSPEPPVMYEELLQIELIMQQLPRVLKQTGSIWVNMSDYHNVDGILAAIPERFLYDMVVEHGWKLINTIIWDRTASLYPCDFDSARRFRRDHEYLYWFVKDVDRYYFKPDANASDIGHSVISIRYEEPKQGVFESGFPTELIERTALLTTPPGGRILDPFAGTATTGVVALQAGRQFLGIESNPALIPKINKRLLLD